MCKVDLGIVEEFPVELLWEERVKRRRMAMGMVNSLKSPCSWECQGLENYSVGNPLYYVH